ncbi:MAG: D-2-hydroxyacid dehydrogenase [Arcicella sp.]|nr:D-2-hydroxyacid dehydrogenase [Arcicella sp.]
MKIYIYTPFAESEIQKLKDALSSKYEVLIKEELPEEQRESVFRTCEICYGNPPLSWLENNNTLQWLQLNSTGLDPYQQLKNYQFKFTNLKGFFAQSVAETALAGILGMYRRIDHLARLQSEKHWVGVPLRATLHLLSKSKVLILGSGAIGLKIRDLLMGFQCETTILNSKTILQLADYLTDTDILIASLPETEETIGLLNQAYLDMLKPSALFVNVGRGSAVEEEYLIKLLQENKIMGAVLDVTEVEPLPVESPLWDMPNVLLTQHSSGGWAAESSEKIMFFLENLKRFEGGEELVNNVDLVKGY